MRTCLSCFLCAAFVLGLVAGCKPSGGGSKSYGYFHTHFQDESQFIVETIVSDLAEQAYYGNNILDAPALNRLRWPKPKRNTPVTLIIGIICKDGIVLAADSQTTRNTSKQSGTDKINVIEFTNGKALVAESGSASLSGRVVEIFQKKATTNEITDESTISKLAEESLREVRQSITSLHPEKNTSEDWQDYFGREINYFELMLAYYFDGKPYLYILNPLWAIPVKSSSYFATSGIAAELANYILKEHTEPQMDSEFASVIAIKVVEDAIEYVEGCGRPTRVALIQSPIKIPDLLSSMAAYGDTSSAAYALHRPSYHLSEPVKIFPQKKIDEIAKIITSVEQQAKSTQNKKIHKELRAQTEKSFRQMLKEVMPPPSKKKAKK